MEKDAGDSKMASGYSEIPWRENSVACRYVLKSLSYTSSATLCSHNLILGLGASLYV